MNNVEALQALYAALGGTPSNVANASTSVEVLNAIAALFDGEDDAILNPEAISNIAAIAGSITPEPTLIEKSITANGTYNASSDNADGYSSVTINVPAPTLTGFSDKTITGNYSCAVVGYYNNAPTAIICQLMETQTTDPIPNFTVLGWIKTQSGPVM